MDVIYQRFRTLCMAIVVLLFKSFSSCLGLGY
jgi:hypothetical protein